MDQDSIAIIRHGTHEYCLPGRDTIAHDLQTWSATSYRAKIASECQVLRVWQKALSQAKLILSIVSLEHVLELRPLTVVVSHNARLCFVDLQLLVGFNRHVVSIDELRSLSTAEVSQVSSNNTAAKLYCNACNAVRKQCQGL